MRTLIAIAILLLTISCNSKPREYFDFGVIENGQYHNRYFNLRMPVPEGWEVFDTTGHAQNNLVGIYPGSLMMTARMVTLKKYAFDTTFDNLHRKVYRARINIYAETRNYPDAAKSGKEEIEKRAELRGSLGKAKPELVGGKEFYTMEKMSDFYDRYASYVKYYARMEKNLMLVIEINFENDMYKKELLDLVSKIRFTGNKQ